MDRWWRRSCGRARSISSGNAPPRMSVPPNVTPAHAGVHGRTCRDSTGRREEREGCRKSHEDAKTRRISGSERPIGTSPRRPPGSSDPHVGGLGPKVRRAPGYPPLPPTPDSLLPAFFFLSLSRATRARSFPRARYRWVRTVATPHFIAAATSSQDRPSPWRVIAFSWGRVREEYHLASSTSTHWASSASGGEGAGWISCRITSRRVCRR